jgi:nitrilase
VGHRRQRRSSLRQGLLLLEEIGVLKVGLAQIAPVFLDRTATTARIVERIYEAGRQGCQLIAFGETLLPAYPVWLCRTDGARFDDPAQKELHALYLDQAVTIEAGHLDAIREATAETNQTVVLGVVERPRDRGGHTVYCSCVVIGADGAIRSVHRKLMPTYEERLSWGIGDGAGLVTHPVGPFTMGALNCWENWMPLARTALYAAGEDLHLALWPGCLRLTQDITRFIAREARSYVVSISGLIRACDIPANVPLRDTIVANEEELYDGGSCVAAPDGTWLLEPQVGVEGLFVVELDPARVRAERQNFDPVGHYARPDVLRLVVDRRRQRVMDDANTRA